MNFERKKCDKIMLKMSQNNSEREREREKERRQCLYSVNFAIVCRHHQVGSLSRLSVKQTHPYFLAFCVVVEFHTFAVLHPRNEMK